MLLKLLILISLVSLYEAKLNEFVKWKQLNYKDLPSGNESFFIQYNNVPQGFFHYKDRIFVGVPRRAIGVPSTLNFIKVDPASTEPLLDPLLEPYPDYNINSLHPNLERDDKRIVSVYRPRVDKCDRLWFIDTGVLEIPNKLKIVQQPSIWVIDLKTNTLLVRHEIPATIVDNGYGLTSLTLDIVDDINNCANTYAYIPDLQTYKLIVFSFAENKSWRFLHNYFYLNPLEGEYFIDGFRYAWDDGIFSIALGPVFDKVEGFRLAYFHALSSTTEFSVSTQILRDESKSKRGFHGQDFRVVGNRGPLSNAGLHVFDQKSGILFFTEMQNNAITCWNSKYAFRSMHFDTVDKSEVTLIYPNDLNIDNDGILWAMSNRMPRYIYGKLDKNDYNFRIWRQTVADAVKDTKCASTASTGDASWVFGK